MTDDDHHPGIGKVQQELTGDGFDRMALMTITHAGANTKGAGFEEGVLHASHLLLHGLQRLADCRRTYPFGAQVADFRELKQIKEGETVGNGDESCFLPSGQLVGRDVKHAKDFRSTEWFHVGSARIVAELAMIIAASNHRRKWKTAQYGGKQGLASLYRFGYPRLQSG